MNIMPHGWMGHQTTLGRRKARLCAFMTLLWSPIAIIGAALLWTLGGTQDWPLSPENPPLAVMAWGMVLLEVVWIALAIAFRVFEQPQPVSKLLRWPAPGPIIHIHSP